MKGYKETEQAFGVGDVVMLEGKKCKVITVIQDEDGSYWYEVEGPDITREVPQSALENI